VGAWVDTKLGLAVGPAITNCVQSWDFTNTAYWQTDAGVTMTTGVVDNTGFAKGAHLVGITATNGLRATQVDLGVAPPADVSFVCWLRSDVGSVGVLIDLMDAHGVVLGTYGPVTVSDTWARVVSQFTTWTDSTPRNAWLRVRAQSGTINLDIAQVTYVESGPGCSTFIPRFPGSGAGPCFVSLGSFTTSQQFCVEGEIHVQGAALVPTPTPGAVCEMLFTSSDYRQLTIDSTWHPVLDHADGSGTDVTSTGSVLDWSVGWELRGRWCAAKTLDNASNAFAGLVYAGSTSGAVYGRGAVWTYGTGEPDQILIGSGAGGSPQVFVSSLVVRTREEKLA
jgi:hypothetical protein